MNKPSASQNYSNHNKLINAFIWRFFGTAFLIFVLFRMIGDFRETSRNELTDQFDVYGKQLEQNQEKLERALKSKPQQ